MRKYLVKIAMSCCLFFGMIVSLNATNYYVSKTGLDTHVGSKESPFLTIGKAASILTAGDTCFIMQGIYREVLSPANHGQSGKPIVFTNYQNDTVTISATEEVKTWDLHNGAIYRAKYNMNLGRQNMVYYNDEPMDWARWPNNTDGNPYTVEGVKVESGSGSTILSSKIPDKNWVGGYVWYLGGHSGASWTREITARSSGKITFVGVDINKWPFNPHNPTIVRNESRGQFYIFGVMDALDYGKEWYFNPENDSVYFQAPYNQNPNENKVEIGERGKTIDIKKNYIHVVGINTFGGSVELEGVYCVLRNCLVKQGLQVLDELDNTSAQIGAGAVYVKASNVIIENNIIDGGSTNGIYVRGWKNERDVIIRRNIVRNFNTIGNHSSLIRAAADYMKVYANEVYNTGRDGVYFSGYNNEISYNDVHHGNLINSDGGAYYTVGNDDKKNTEIHHNWFHDCTPPEYAGYKAAGIYLDNDSKGYSVHHNVVWDVAWTGVQMNWDVWDNDIFHNTLWGVQQAMGTWLKDEHQMLRDRIYNNVASKGDWAGTDIKNNIILGQSPFENLEERNFSPKQGSVLIDKGLVIDGINDGYLGNAPDIGAYEYGVEPWRAGIYAIKDGLPLYDKQFEMEKASFYVRVFPNPTVNKDVFVKINGTISDKEIKVFNGAGQVIFSKITTENKVRIPESELKTEGLYLVVVSDENHRKTSKLIIK